MCLWSTRWKCYWWYVKWIHICNFINSARLDALGLGGTKERIWKMTWVKKWIMMFMKLKIMKIY